MRFRGAGFSDLGEKGGQEDRWAIAELPDGIVAAIADGMSDATGRNLGGNSAAVAEVACNFFVDDVSRSLVGNASVEEVLKQAFHKTMERCEYTARTLGGGATLRGGTTKSGARGGGVGHDDGGRPRKPHDYCWESGLHSS